MRVFSLCFVLALAFVCICQPNAEAQTWGSANPLTDGSFTSIGYVDTIADLNIVRVVFSAFDVEGVQGIYYTQYTSGVWSSPQLVTNVDGGVTGLDIINTTGQFIFYSITENGNSYIYVVSDGGSGGLSWLTPTVLDSSIGSTILESSQMRVIERGGIALIVWQATNAEGPGGFDFDIWYCTFDSSLVSGPALLNVAGASDSTDDIMPGVGYHPVNGEFYCTWVSHENAASHGTVGDVELAISANGSSWSVPMLMSGTNGINGATNPLYPVVSTAGTTTDAVVAWEDITSDSDIYYTVYSPGAKSVRDPFRINSYMSTDADSDETPVLLRNGEYLFVVWQSSYDLDNAGNDYDIFYSPFIDGVFLSPGFVNDAANDGSDDNVFPMVIGDFPENWVGSEGGYVTWLNSASQAYYQPLLFTIDSDGDGLADEVETNTGTYVNTTDTGTNPNDPDSDNDGIPDGFEVDNGLDPTSDIDLILDSDGDGRTNAEEYQQGTNINFPDSPSSTVYVDAAIGDDSTGDGAANAPFKTISRGLSEASLYATANFPMEVLVSAGVYTEHLVIPAHVAVRGINRDTTIIQHSDGSTSLVAMDDNTGLHTVTLRWANVQSVPSKLIAAALTPANTGFVIDQCVLDGLESPDSTGLRIAGGTAGNAILADNILKNLTTAIAAAGSGINVTRNEIMNISGDAVVVNVASKQSGQNVPLLGDDADIANTALNRFRDVDGLFIKNSTTEQVNAEMNDWGIYDRDAVGNNIQGPSDFGPIIGKSIAPGGVVASLYVGETDTLVDVAANPVCTIPALGLTAQRDAASGLFIFESVSSGSFSVQGMADGFASDAQQVNVSPASINAVNLRLVEDTGNNPNDPPVTPAPPSCGKTGKVSYAFCGLLLWAVGSRVRRKSGH